MREIYSNDWHRFGSWSARLIFFGIRASVYTEVEYILISVAMLNLLIVATRSGLERITATDGKRLKFKVPILKLRLS